MIFNDCKSERSMCASMQGCSPNYLTCKPLPSLGETGLYNCQGLSNNGILPQAYVEIVVSQLWIQHSYPTGIWADFHCVHILWLQVVNMVRLGYVSCSQLPPQPDPLAYPDITSESTLYFCNSCGKLCCDCKKCEVPITGSAQFFRG